MLISAMHISLFVLIINVNTYSDILIQLTSLMLISARLL